ncbi:LysR family transcriptional regulator [Pseudorhodoferax sp. Leaf274]|uniref:LysR family transcriptional regulator n=1 Tax=Pseudorhodoferax sp. Leaf274 TaxID=1736318 RepID=UPI0009E729AC|nr:LysR family transcriptional regulator [Pseudorhodoferax sp. Leaf274]
MKSVPPTPLIAAFDAVARLRSFNRAADELCLSHSTISHRIRELEKTVGVSLFARTTRVVTLTAEGAHLHRQIKGALHTLEQAFGPHASKQSTVRVSALPSFARFRLILLYPI